MSQTFTAQLLSGSTNGKMIKVVATATLGTTIHTAVAGTSSMDEIDLWAVNSSGSDVLLTIEWGGATSPDCLVPVVVPARDGVYHIIPLGWRLQNGLAVTAFAATANVIMVGGSVNRIV